MKALDSGLDGKEVLNEFKASDYFVDEETEDNKFVRWNFLLVLIETKDNKIYIEGSG